jgi:hypothetical protein
MTTPSLVGRRVTRRLAFAFVAGVTTTGMMLLAITPAGAAIVPTVPLSTAAAYAVVAGSTVTNTGPSVINGSVGLSPGTSVTGFPPATVVPPGTIDATNAAAAQAQAHITTAYNNAAGRSVTATTAADLANLQLQGGVYAGPSHGALQLTGPLVLDGAGNPNSVFIFQTNSSLTTASSSTVTLINGAQECNVFWQVGSSATLGTASVFRGNILALASVTVTTGVTVHGRAFASTAAVTLDTDVFVRPTCDLTTPTTPTTAPGGGGPGSTTPSSLPGGGGTPTTLPGGGGGTATTLPGGGTGTTLPGNATPTLPGTPSGSPGVPPIAGPPRTGGTPLHSTSSPWFAALIAGLFGTALLGGTMRARRTASNSSGR